MNELFYQGCLVYIDDDEDEDDDDEEEEDDADELSLAPWGW